jgi:pentatricopeptide repeat protein
MVLEAMSYYDVDNNTWDDDTTLPRKESSSTDIVWNTATIVQMADELMEQLHELYKNQIWLKSHTNQQHPASHAYKRNHASNTIVPEDLLVAQNSYLRLLARYCDRRQQSRSSTSSIDLHPNLADKAEDYLWNHMKQSQSPKSPLPPNMKSYSAVLQAHVNQNAPDQACLVLNRMINQGIQPDQICYNICLQALGNAGHATEAYNLLLQMIEMSKYDKLILQPPDVYSYLAVIKAYAKVSDVTNMIHVFEQMIQNNIIPNTVIYTTVLDTLAHQPNSGPLVDQMLQYLERLHYGDANNGPRHRPNLTPTGITSTTVKPCREAYTIAVRAWGNTTNDVSAPDHATNVFRRMHHLSVLQEQERGDYTNVSRNSHNGTNNDLSPCTISYTSLIHAWAQSHRKDAPDRAVQILRFMEQQPPNGVIPDSITYNVVLNALARHGLATEAHELLNEMIGRMMHGGDIHSNEKRIMYPNVISWATVIQAYSNSQRSDAWMKANDLLLELEHLYDTTGLKSLQPTADIYAVTILAQKWGDHIAIAEQIFSRIIDRYQRNSILKNNPPNTSVCNALLRLWSTSNDPVAPQRAESILSWMEDHRNTNATQQQSNDDGAPLSYFLEPNIESYQHVLQTWYRSKRRNANLHIQNILRKMEKHKST